MQWHAFVSLQMLSIGFSLANRSLYRGTEDTVGVDKFSPMMPSHDGSEKEQQLDDSTTSSYSTEQPLARSKGAKPAGDEMTEHSPPLPDKLECGPRNRKNAGWKSQSPSGVSTPSGSRHRSPKARKGKLKTASPRSPSRAGTPLTGSRTDVWRKACTPAGMQTPQSQQPWPNRTTQAGTDALRPPATGVSAKSPERQPKEVTAEAEGFRRPAVRSSPPSPGGIPLRESSTGFPILIALGLSDKRLSDTFSVPSRSVSRLEKIVAATACITLVVVVVLGVMKIIWPVLPDVSKVCFSRTCRFYADRLLLSINKSVNPCDDFTQFVCGGWQREHALDVWEEHFGRILSELHRHLKSINWRVVGQNEYQRAAAVYHSCDFVFRGMRDELQAVKAALSDAGIVWPKPSAGADALYTMLYCSLKLGWDSLLRFGVEHSGGTNKLLVSPGRSLHIVLFRQAPKEDGYSKQIYFNLLRESFRDGGDATITVTYEHMSAVSEPALNELSENHLWYYEQRYEVNLTAEALGVGLAAARLTETLKMLNLSLPSGLQMATMYPIFLAALLRIWERYGEDTFHLFVSWCTVQVAALYANRRLILNYYNLNLDKALVYHTAFCVSRAAFFSAKAVFNIFNTHVQRGNAAARKMAIAVRLAFSRRVSRWPSYNESVTVVSKWDSLETAFRAFEKLGVPQVPDMTDSFVTNWRNSVFVRSSALEAKILESICQLWFYNVDWQKPDFMLMPYALTYPFFDTELPAPINYGGLGWEMASALGSLFLSSYREHNATKVLTECIEPPDIAERNQFYTARAIGYGALVDAFKTSDAALSKAIPSFGDYTDLQLLFIASCHGLCLGGLSNQYPVCDLFAQHIPEFSEAFQCASRDPMNRFAFCQLP